MTEEPVPFLTFARSVLDALQATDITYLVGGAVAVWAWGEPRSTQDLDLVIHLPGTHIRRLSQELEKRRMLVPPTILFDLLIQPEGDLPVNAIQMDTGYKAELFLLRPGDEFRTAALHRRMLVDLGPALGDVYVHAPDDLILNKVRYYSLSRQSKHIRDIASIVVSPDTPIDWDYFDQWLQRLGIEEPWSEIKSAIESMIGRAFK
jgi:hypothetical protein